MAKYIDNDELEAELEKWRTSAEAPEDRVPSERLGQLMLDLHNGILRHRNFNGYNRDLKEEMRSFSLLRIFKRGLFSFKPGKTSAFSYFTRAVFTNYVTVVMRYYARLNKHQEYVKGCLMRLAENGDQKLAKYIDNFKTSIEGD